MTGRNIGRRQAVIGTGAAVMTTAAWDARWRRTATWRLTSRRACEKDGRVFGLHAAGLGERPHGVRVLRNGRGRDLGEPLGKVTFGPDVLHDLRSVSKSMVRHALWHRARATGKVPPPEARLRSTFPQYADLASQPGA